ncbi:ParM/StbA family protein [Paraclostridium bifermentans]|uniref:ParM/StbA family protein n=1 Tax=Paraclostridium bifermentans TaxID=1490 RepID=UPI001C1248DE|nr:ParM/StbA family protein [Paraclostridium bifermentans]MBU5289969.1 ParM/StbA family protein [Paraclostridium bifermentans]
MISIASIDVGNLTTIGVCEENSKVVESRIKEFSNIKELGNNKVVEMDNKKYVVEDGSFENNLIKHEKENFLTLLYYTLAEVVDEDRVKLVIGIPAGQYNSRRDELKEFIMENNFRKVTVGLDKDAVTKKIYIEDVLVVPESYGLKANGVMSQCEKGLKTYVVDIGGGTTDIAEFDEQGNFVDGESIKTGLLKVYRNTRKVLGDKPYNLDIDLADAKKYFDGDLDLLSKDVSYKQEIMFNCIKKIVNELRGLYPNLENSNVILTGGGAEKVYPTFKKIYPQTIPVTDIKANAKGFYKIGVKAWQEK